MIVSARGAGVTHAREDERSGSLFGYVDLEARIDQSHPLRMIRMMVNEALAGLRRFFGAVLADERAVDPNPAGPNPCSQSVHSESVKPGDHLKAYLIETDRRLRRVAVEERAQLRIGLLKLNDASIEAPSPDRAQRACRRASRPAAACRPRERASLRPSLLHARVPRLSRSLFATAAHNVTVDATLFLSRPGLGKAPRLRSAPGEVYWETASLALDHFGVGQLPSRRVIERASLRAIAQRRPWTGRSAAAASHAAGCVGDGLDHFVRQRGPGQALAELGYQVGAAS